MTARSCLLSLCLLSSSLAAAEPKRPSAQAVQQWQDRKFGLFIHWGLYAIPGGIWQGKPVTRGYSEQIQGEGKIARDEYAQLTTQFNPQKWDPEAVARLAKAAGMKFIVITSKHHDGFSMFGTRQSKFNVVDATPYGKDVVKGLAEACRRNGLKFGVYYSTIDWHDERATPSDGGRNNNEIPKAHEDFNVAQLKELMSNYGPMSEIWFDMGKPTPEQSKRFTDTVHALQPDCMVSGRVFNHQGDFTVMGDNHIPPYVIDEPWQTPASIYHETWGYRSWQKREDLPGKINEHIIKLVEVTSRGGNYLLNIGPMGDGSVVEFEQKVLEGIGAWVKVNGEAIYGAGPQPFREVAFGQVTVKPGRMYLMVRQWPADGKLELPGLKTKLRKAYFLTDSGKTPLILDNGSPVKSVTVTKRLETAPVTVIVAEYDGALTVIPPTLQPAASGALTLTSKQADSFYNYNGRGYYERPSVYKMEWHFTSKPGKYRLTVAPTNAGMAVTIDGKPAGEQVELMAGEYHTLAITPPKPFVKGDRLATVVESVRLTPQ
ncbi:alpha-L-fucosidase [Paludibaculum fermentans]|uniref:alpha-L-fucosidase n=1 Tax=Paludibaculum fermentans TaxID=1473598 RepID=A0A7S7NS12_PALFE|nr:alpha-L-fucosidase [Paludibaculum fermentans]QOY88609.1 alpha-L-fucosidase [Paludibaculum fermentans]